MLTRQQFDILAYLATHRNVSLPQRKLAQVLGKSLGTVHSALAFLAEEKLIADKTITEAGLQALEPYRVKRAVFLAAGFGSRLIPITFNTPKPLVRVNGVRIIDTLLDAVIAAGITDITIVRGYLAEQFDQLLYKYPMIKFIDNPAFNVSNNISSAYEARHLLANSYVLESDLLLRNSELITPYQYCTNYLAIPVEKTDDWCFMTGRQDRITGMAVGGLNCHQMVGISYWDDATGKQLANDIERVMAMPGGKERYWDQVALQQYLSDYHVYIRECKAKDVAEIDTYAELKALDPLYNI